MYEYACAFHNLLFSIYSVDHRLNHILEYKNVRDITIYMFCSFFCLCMYLLLSNRPVGAQVGHAGPVVNRIGLSFNMEEERIVCDP